MSGKHTEDFKLEAVRIAPSSGLPRTQIAGDLGVGKSTLSKWLAVYRPSDILGDLARLQLGASGRSSMLGAALCERLLPRCGLV